MDRKSVRPPTSLRLICDAAREWGCSTADCLENTGLDPERLNDADFTLTRGQEIIAIENVVRLAPQQAGMGVAAGKGLHLGSFGIYGFAILTSPNLRSAIETAIKYANLSFVIAEMTMRENGHKARLEFDMSPLAPSIHRFVLERHAHVCLTFFRDFVSDTQFANFCLCTELEGADYADELAAILGIRVEAAADVNALVFPARLLDAALPKSDPVTQQYCIEQCKALLSKSQPSLLPWSLQVRDSLVAHISGNPKIEMIADELQTTERTLRRRLRAEGTSYRQLYTHTRLSLARELLEQAGLSVETVSWRVGYAEPAAFIRAFAKQYGKTPGTVRGTRLTFDA